MKQFKRGIEKNGPGYVGLIAEEAEDMWQVFNLIRVGDIVKCSTIRKVTSESSTGTTSSQRMHTTLTVKVEAIDFDPGACALHLKGRNIVENDLVKLGAYHTLDIEPNRKFTLEKEEWDSIDINRLNEALDPALSADVAAVVMHEGLAHVCLLTPAMTLVKAKIDMQIPRKRKGFSSQHDKGLDKFLDAVCAAILRHVNFQVIKCVLVASRGFLKDHLMTHLLEYADKEGKKLTGEQKAKFMLTHSSSGFKHALKEVLEDENVAARLTDTKAQGEVRTLNEFFDLLAVEPERAFYGIKHVEIANKEKAIDKLLLTDSLFRANCVQTRRKYVRLVESVKDDNGKVFIFSSMHVSGEQLANLTGCAAILRYPMPELADDGSFEDD